MTILNFGLVVLVCAVVPVVVWIDRRWAVLVLAIFFFVLQIFLLMVYMDSVGRMVVQSVIESGGPVKEVADALTSLKAAQWSARMALLLSAAGLFLLAGLRGVRKVN